MLEFYFVVVIYKLMLHCYSSWLARIGPAWYALLLPSVDSGLTGFLRSVDALRIDGHLSHCPRHRACDACTERAINCGVGNAVVVGIAIAS